MLIKFWNNFLVAYKWYRLSVIKICELRVLRYPSRHTIPNGCEFIVLSVCLFVCFSVKAACLMTSDDILLKPGHGISHSLVRWQRIKTEIKKKCLSELCNTLMNLLMVLKCDSRSSGHAVNEHQKVYICTCNTSEMKQHVNVTHHWCPELQGHGHISVTELSFVCIC